MLGFDNIRIQSYDELLEFVSEEEILYYYFGEFQPNIHYLCPIKKKDGIIEVNPSFYISYREGKLKWRSWPDYPYPMGVLDFVMIIYNINYNDALQMVYRDIYKGGKSLTPKKIQDIKRSAKDEIEMCIVIRDWQDYDIEYWNQYYFSKEILEKWEISSAKELWVGENQDKRRTHISSKNDPMFCFSHSDFIKHSFTAYRPYAPSKYKFRKYNITGHIMGWGQLPEKGDIVFITSSLKDIITLSLLGIPAIAPHTEVSHIPQVIIDSLKKRFKNIYVAYDNDSTGVESSIKLTKKHDLNYWNVPKDCEDCKDPSDMSKNLGLKDLRNSIYEKIKRDGNR